MALYYNKKYRFISQCLSEEKEKEQKNERKMENVKLVAIIRLYVLHVYVRCVC